MEKVKFNYLFDFLKKSNLKASDEDESGEFPFYTSSSVVSKRTNKPIYDQVSLVIGNGGSANIHYADIPFATTSHCYIAVAKSQSVSTKYCYYFLHINIHLLERGFKGAGLKNISSKYIEGIEIPLPDLETQNKIVAILDKAKTILDKREKTIALYDELLRATFLDMFGDPVTNEKGWELLRVSDVGESRLGKMLDSKKIIGDNLKPYLRNSNVQWLKFQLDDLAEMDFDEKDKIEFSLTSEDVLMCEGGEIGRCAIWRNEIEGCYFQKAIHRIRFNKETILPEYFVYMFYLYTSFGGLKQYMSAATISHFTGNNLKQLIIPVPSIYLQKSFKKIYLKIEASKQKLNQSKKQIKNLFNVLSQLAFKGELGFNIAVDLEVLLEENYDFSRKTVMPNL